MRTRRASSASPESTFIRLFILFYFIYSFAFVCFIILYLFEYILSLNPFDDRHRQLGGAVG